MASAKKGEKAKIEICGNKMLCKMRAIVDKRKAKISILVRRAASGRFHEEVDAISKPIR